MHAIENDHVELAKLLIVLGADLKIQDNAKQNAIYYAQRNFKYDLFEDGNKGTEFER